jgi:probable aminopeptidase NPEPL1
MTVSLDFQPDPNLVRRHPTLLVIGRAKSLRADLVRRLLPDDPSRDVWMAMLDETDAGDHGRLGSTFLPGGRRLAVGVLPEPCSRHNAPSRAWAIPRIVAGAPRKGPLGVIVVVDDPAHAYALGLALAAGFPTYSATSRPSRDRTVEISFLGPAGKPVTDLERIRVGAEAVRRAAHWVDQPPNELSTDELVASARALADGLPGARFRSIRGEALVEAGLNGLFAVGRASARPPALVCLEWDAAPDAPRVGWVGKGIVYDTGGLSLKQKTSMPGMKNDMAGAAAVLAAFEAAVRLRAPLRLSAVLCVAENAIGPNATRPDDVVRMFSGRTVEVNNTDAEGRLVLADGLAWAASTLGPELLIDLATLTGAQSLATGLLHAGVYATSDALESRVVTAGRASGNLCHPLPFAPELFRAEFSSPVADLRNSVKNRNNAQSSCAGQFILEHLGAYRGEWCHVDMAGPAMSGGRATGYGVALLLTLAGVGAWGDEPARPPTA